MALGCVLWCAGALAQETGFTLRETEVKAKPFLDAENIGKLPEKAQVSILARQGGWSQVRAGDVQGWVRLLSLRFGNPDPKKNQTALATSIGFGRQRPGAGPTVTTGVRGFSEEDLKAAKPNPEEVRKMESFSIPPAGASQFAAAGKLVAQAVSYVDADGKSIKVKK
jgi:hypothetical protein